MTRTLLSLLAALALALTACGGTRSAKSEPATAAPPTEPAATTVTPPTAADDVAVRCGARTRHTCGPGQYCAFSTRICDAADRTGVCQPFPAACGAEDPPVCTCGGATTFANVCEAQRAGVKKLAMVGCPAGMAAPE